MESATSAAGDYVGIESCVDLRNDEEFESFTKDCERSYERRRLVRESNQQGISREVVRRRRMELREREFIDPPPMITCLTRTRNQRSHMPWVMKRYHTADGRLVIREEKVRRNEYFRAYQANNRLVLQLVNVDFDIEEEDRCSVLDHGVNVWHEPQIDQIEDDRDEAEEDANEEEKEDVDDQDGKMMSSRMMVSSVSMSALCITMAVGSSSTGGGGGFGLALTPPCPSKGGRVNKKCSGLYSFRSSSASCLFDLQVPAIRPVLT